MKFVVAPCHVGRFRRVGSVGSEGSRSFVAVTLSGWRLCYFPAELPAPPTPPPFQSVPAVDWVEWREAAAIPPRTPFLLSPKFHYDVDLNSFFLSGDMLCQAWNTQDGYARDLKAFLNFLWHNRSRTSWRDATSADHLAYLVWRRKDPAGPRVDDATLDREVTAVNRFYAWQVSAMNLPVNPIPQRRQRPLPPTSGCRGRREAATTPATYSHGAAREKIEWLPPAAYRRWRDIGMRGYTPNGLLNSGFRGRWAARNALFSDVMVRTGLRLAEQTALTVFEMPLDRGLGAINDSGCRRRSPRVDQHGGCMSRNRLSARRLPTPRSTGPG